VLSRKANNAYLYLHTAPTGDVGIDVEQLAKYYGVVNRIILVEPPTWYGLNEDGMADSYNCFDVYASTTQGEGFGLPALEAMACGVPCVLPDWSGFGDWAKDGAWLVPCKTTAVGPPYVNVVGGIPDEGQFVTALHALYSNQKARENNSVAALECASQERFDWRHIGERWVEALATTLDDASLIKPAEEVSA
jgi:glycosyltransferase involved in cell wall biosynthesis